MLNRKRVVEKTINLKKSDNKMGGGGGGTEIAPSSTQQKNYMYRNKIRRKQTDLYSARCAGLDEDSCWHSAPEGHEEWGCVYTCQIIKSPPDRKRIKRTFCT